MEWNVILEELDYPELIKMRSTIGYDAQLTSKENKLFDLYQDAINNIIDIQPLIEYLDDNHKYIIPMLRLIRYYYHFYFNINEDHDVVFDLIKHYFGTKPARYMLDNFPPISQEEFESITYEYINNLIDDKIIVKEDFDETQLDIKLVKDVLIKRDAGVAYEKLYILNKINQLPDLDEMIMLNKYSIVGFIMSTYEEFPWSKLAKISNDNFIKTIDQENWSNEEWDDMLYDELFLNGNYNPLLYLLTNVISDINLYLDEFDQDEFVNFIEEINDFDYNEEYSDTVEIINSLAEVE